MTLTAPISKSSLKAGRRQGMTLIEMMFTVALMSLVIAGVMSANLVGLREDQLMESKAGMSDASRYAIGQLLYDIKSAKGYDIGTDVSAGTNFIIITNGTFLQGGALRLYTAIWATNQSVNQSAFTEYYFNTTNASISDGKLCRFSSAALTPVIVASNLINSFYFTSEDYLGNTQTVRTYKGVVHTTLQFRQFQYPLTTVGTNGIFDYYRIECRATPHLPDGP